MQAARLPALLAVPALQREQQPGQLYLSAARAAIERRKVAAFIAGMHGGKPPAPPGQVTTAAPAQATWKGIAPGVPIKPYQPTQKPHM